MQLQTLTGPELIFPDLPRCDRSSLLRVFAQRLVDAGVASDVDEVHLRLWEREQLGSTGIGDGVAIPHCKLDRLERVVLAIGLADPGIDFQAADGEPVRLFFCVVSPADQPAAHLQCLAAISKWIKADRHVEKMLRLEDAEAIYRFLEEQ